MKKLLLAITITSVLTGCASNPTAQSIAKDEAKAFAVKAELAAEKAKIKQDKAESYINNLPSWVLEPPKPDSEGVYGIGIAESESLNLAMKKARLNAQFELAKNYKQELSGSERSYEQDNGSTGGLTREYTSLIDNLVDSVEVVGYRVIEQEVYPIDGKMNAFVLVKLPYDKYNEMLKNKKEESNDEKIKAAFDDLQQRLDKRQSEELKHKVANK